VSLEASLMIKKFFCGGTAGCTTWFACYPMDTVKTRMQTHEGPDRLKFRKALLNVLQTPGGVKRLYRGIHVQLMRAFPSSASSLLVYETVKGALKEHQRE
jgi:solute carrier family 25 (mitochondrial carnitine/acylcarnitine transporter), member 20/29